MISGGSLEFLNDTMWEDSNRSEETRSSGKFVEGAICHIKKLAFHCLKKLRAIKGFKKTSDQVRFAIQEDHVDGYKEYELEKRSLDIESL